MIQLIIEMWLLIGKRRRSQCYKLIILMVLASMSEVVSIGAVVPFLAVLSMPSIAFEKFGQIGLFKYWSFESPASIVLPMVISFCAITVVSGGVRLYVLRRINYLSFTIGADLSADAYKKILYSSYESHCKQNSSELISALTSKINAVIYNAVLPMLTIISSLFLISSILLAMVLIEPIIAIASFGAFATIYLVVAIIVRGRLQKDSKIISVESNKTIQNLQESLGAIRDIIIDGSQYVYIDKYSKADVKLRLAQGSTVFLSQAPKYAVESLGIVAIAIIAYLSSVDAGASGLVLPVLGMIALGAQRLLPILQQAYWSWTNAIGCKESLSDIIDLLNKKMPIYYGDENVEVQAPIKFMESIAVKNLNFKYDETAKTILNNINFKIEKGSVVGVIGSTGSGKSTLVDVVMGLLVPTEGGLEVDGVKINQHNVRYWQKKISHVPQSIYLTDGSILENIALGVAAENIDMARIELAIKCACLDGVVNDLELGINTLVGENGVKLSGGQRQRIGIARAIYKCSELIIFDEATSALDSLTEELVMKNISELTRKPTMLMIAHRFSSLKYCDYIIEIVNGEINMRGSYDNIAYGDLLNSDKK